MNIILNRKALLEKLSIVKAGISGRSSLPILSHILLQSDGEKLVLTGNDLEMAVTTSMELPLGSGAGMIALPLATFQSIINGFSTDEVTIKDDAKCRTLLKSGKSQYTILSLPGSEYPKPPETKEKACFTIQASEFKGALSEVTRCVSDDANRAILTGVLFLLNEGVLTLVATDTHRLGVTSRNVESTGGYTGIVPERFISELSNLLKGDGLIQASLGENHVTFTVDDNVLVSNLIAGQYPNYQRVIPTASGIVTWTVSNTELASVVKRAQIVSKENSYRVILEAGKDGVLKVSAESQVVGECHDELEIAVEGSYYSNKETFQVAFNSKYLLDALASAPGDKVEFNLSEPLRPGVLKVVGNNAYMGVLMPMAIL